METRIARCAEKPCQAMERGKIWNDFSENLQVVILRLSGRAAWKQKEPYNAGGPVQAFHFLKTLEEEKPSVHLVHCFWKTDAVQPRGL